MDDTETRVSEESLASVQAGNRQWWTERTMSYDWKNKIKAEKMTPEWFDEIDRRFIHGARLFAHDKVPFDRIIPFESLKGKKVLEIGCGMGLHTELMIKAGADVTSIDLSDTSVLVTSTRTKNKNLSGQIVQMDAVELQFPDETFDFIWSWGVIHHSSHTGRIIKEMYRVLKPGGESRVMVYHLDGMPAYITMVRRYLLKFWKGVSLDHCLWSDSDGYTARYYTKDMLSDMLNIFFNDVVVETYGQDADAVPLPYRLRQVILPWISFNVLKKIANKRGGFLFAIAKK